MRWELSVLARVTIKTEQKPETALEKSLAPRVLMHRKSKEINPAKLNSKIIITEHVSCNMIFERPFRTNANVLRSYNNEA